MPPPQNPQLPLFTPRSWLGISFIIWGALLLGQILFFCVVLFQRANGQAPSNPDLAQLFLLIGAAMLVTAVPIGFIFRRAMHRRGEGKVETEKLGLMLTGNLILWASCEGTSFFGILAFMLTGRWDCLIASALAVAVQLTTFPRLTAAPMFPDVSQPGARRP